MKKKHIWLLLASNLLRSVFRSQNSSNHNALLFIYYSYHRTSRFVCNMENMQKHQPYEWECRRRLKTTKKEKTGIRRDVLCGVWPLFGRREHEEVSDVWCVLNKHCLLLIHNQHNARSRFTTSKRIFIYVKRLSQTATTGNDFWSIGHFIFNYSI